MARLTPEQWQSIRIARAVDPDVPTLAEAGRRGGQVQFTARSKTTIDSRAEKEGWGRKGTITGINQASRYVHDA